MKIRQEFVLMAIPAKEVTKIKQNFFLTIGMNDGRKELIGIFPLDNTFTVENAREIANDISQEEIIRVRYDRIWEFINPKTGKINFSGMPKRYKFKNPKVKSYTIIDGWYWTVERK